MIRLLVPGGGHGRGDGYSLSRMRLEGDGVGNGYLDGYYLNLIGGNGEGCGYGYSVGSERPADGTGDGYDYDGDVWTLGYKDACLFTE